MNSLHRRTLTLRAELKFHGKGPTAHNPGGEFCAVGYFPQKRSKCRSNVTDRRPGFVECTPLAPREDPPIRQSRMEPSRGARGVHQGEPPFTPFTPPRSNPIIK